MGKHSTIAYLPDDIIALAVDKIDNENYTQEEVTDWINDELEGRWRPIITHLNMGDKLEFAQRLESRYCDQKKLMEWVKAKLPNTAITLKIFKISKSAINRYWLTIERDRAELKIAREAASRVISGLDGSNDLGQAVAELIKKITFNLIMNRPKDMDAKAQLAFVNQLSNISKKIAEASKYDSDRLKQENEIRAQERAEAAKEIGEFTQKAGLSPEIAQQLLEAIGVKNGN